MQQPELLLANGTVLDPENNETRQVDIRISEGRIVEIGPNLDAGDTPVEDCTDRMISPGWFDMHVHFREPGYEHKETIATGARAAAAGGFTGAACMPNTDPPIHTRDVVEYVIEQAEGLPVDVHPIGCVSKDRAGEQLAEMADLEEGGAVAFSDDGSPVQHSGLMRRALEYSSMLDRPIINHMEDLTLNVEGHMHEGAVATHLGLAGIPAAAEEVMIARDAILAEYTDGFIHVAHISTARGVELVRQAKARGVAITAEVCPHHFALTDQAVADTNFSTDTKMHPPLRSPEDIEAIKEGLADGTIDAICTDHAPHATFEKEVEFTQAPFGIIGLETAWGLVGRELIEPGVLTVAEAVDKLTVAPRRILRLPIPAIEEGAAANLTIFDASTRWTFTEEDIRSKSINSPFVGSELVGRPHAIYNDGQLVRQSESLAVAS